MKAVGNLVGMSLNAVEIADESDPEFKIAEIMSGLDYRELRRTYRRHWRCIAPEILFSIVVCADMKGILSSGDKAAYGCKQNAENDSI